MLNNMASEVARAYHTSWRMLALYNCLPDPDRIEPGLEIFIPGTLPVGTVEKSILSGLYSEPPSNKWTPPDPEGNPKWMAGAWPAGKDLRLLPENEVITNILFFLRKNDGAFERRF
jgi:hypothetical protein